MLQQASMLALLVGRGPMLVKVLRPQEKVYPTFVNKQFIHPERSAM